MNKLNEEAYLIKLGKRIRDLREAAGLSREDLAEAIDTTRMQVYRIENGIKKNSPTIILLIRIAVTLKVDISELVKK